MALTGLKINKLLPGTNCKECGSNTCLAFAMKLAGQKAELSQCPYASDEAKKVLGAAAEPPVRGVAFGAEKSVKTGEETVLYRHEKTFVNQTVFAVNINDTDDASVVDAKLKAVKEYVLERVGEILTIEMASVTQKKETCDDFIKLAKRAYEATGKPLVLQSEDPEALTKAAEAVKGSNSLIAGAPPETAQALVKAAQENGHALAITAPTLDALVKLASDVREGGFNDIMLQPETFSPAERFQTYSIARRMALKNEFKQFGYSFLNVIPPGDLYEVTEAAVSCVCKYSGICVLPYFEPAQMAPLMTLRQNIYTDPQKPIQVDPKIYEIGSPEPGSPVFVTTNFSLTYFIVSGEIENAGLSAYLLTPECEGQSVLTAWAAGKFNGATIGRFCKEIGLEEKVTGRDMIIPGYVAQIVGDLEENMPGWNIIVGPQEAADLESFIKNKLAA